MNLSSVLVAVAAFSVSAAAFAAEPHNDDHSAMANGHVGDPAKADRTINIVMYDNYFDPESLSIKPGETVRFVVENQGNLVHEFNIGTASSHEAHQKEMMMMVQHGVIQGGKLNHDRMQMDMGHGQTMMHDEPGSVLLEPGQTQELVWQFPEQGSLEFACNVPGHYQAGMYGEITLK